jgi:hypothetical protein
MSSFTLFKLNDFKKRVLEVRNICNKKNLKVWQTDVKCMFTNLSKEGIENKIARLIELYKNIFRGKPKGITVSKTAPYTCYKGINLGIDDTEEIDFELMKRVVLWDLQSTYSRFGDVVLYQKEGLPIGGMCSSIYADIQCAFDENTYLNREDVNTKRLVGIRQIDDLLILAPDPKYKDEIVDAYDKGLTLETEEVEAKTQRNGTTTYSMHYIGLDLTLNKGRVRSKVSNKNIPSIIQNGRQLKPRFTPPSVYRSGALYKQIISGALYRVRDYSIGNLQIRQAIAALAIEFEHLKYPKTLFRSVLKKFIKTKVEGIKKPWISACQELPN